jgi:hypothetical protein
MTIQLDDALHGLAECSASVDRTAAFYLRTSHPVHAW